MTTSQEIADKLNKTFGNPATSSLQWKNLLLPEDQEQMIGMELVAHKEAGVVTFNTETTGRMRSCFLQAFTLMKLVQRNGNSLFYSLVTNEARFPSSPIPPRATCGYWMPTPVSACLPRKF